MITQSLELHPEHSSVARKKVIRVTSATNALVFSVEPSSLGGEIPSIAFKIRFEFIELVISCIAYRGGFQR